MKVTVSKPDLRDAIAHVTPAVAVKPSTPILAGIYLHAEHSELTIRATNFELDITVKIPANVEVAGEVVVIGKHFAAIVNKLGGEIVTLTDDGGDSAIKVKSEAASFEIFSMDASDFPPPAKLDDGEAFRIPTIDFKEVIRQTVFACAGKDASQTIFTGVNFVLDGANLTAVATNAKRVAIAKANVFDETSANFIVPATTLKFLQGAIEIDRVVTSMLAGNQVVFEFDNVRLISRLISGKFPPAEKVIPKDFGITAEVGVDELRTAIARMQVISSNNEYNQILFKFDAEGLEISTSSKDVGKAIEHVDANVTGNGLAIAFNSQYVMDALRVFDVKTCKFSMNEPLTPALITADGETLTYVVTPLRV